MSQPGRVLLVDGREQRDGIAAALDAAGFEVSSVNGVPAATDRLARAPVDCVVSTYQVPRRDGLEFLGGFHALEALAERVEELEQDQQRQAAKSAQESEPASEFVFETPSENGETVDGESETSVKSPNSGGTIDPSADGPERHENSQAAERLPPQQQRVNETYGTESHTADTQQEESSKDESGTFGTLLSFDNGMPEWLKK